MPRDEDSRRKSHLRARRAPQCLAGLQLARNRGTFFSQSLDFRFCLIRQRLCSCHLGQDGGTLSSAQIWQCLSVACPPPQRKTLLKERHHRNSSSWKKQSKGLEENKLITSETNSACSERRTQGKGQTEKKWFTLKWECEVCVLDLLGVRGTLRHRHFCGRARTLGCSLLGKGCRESSRGQGRAPLGSAALDHEGQCSSGGAWNARDVLEGSSTLQSSTAFSLPVFIFGFRCVCATNTARA